MPGDQGNPAAPLRERRAQRVVVLMIVTRAVQALVLAHVRGGRKIGAEPQVAPPLGEIDGRRLTGNGRRRAEELVGA
jgi:hypothetical protein